jgi:hypothetical protein
VHHQRCDQRPLRSAGLGQLLRRASRLSVGAELIFRAPDLIAQVVYIAEERDEVRVQTGERFDALLKVRHRESTCLQPSMRNGLGVSGHRNLRARRSAVQLSCMWKVPTAERKAARPAPWIEVDRHARAHGDGADVDVAEVDEPRMSSAGGAAAGQDGRGG